MIDHEEEPARAMTWLNENAREDWTDIGRSKFEGDDDVVQSLAELLRQARREGYVEGHKDGQLAMRERANVVVAKLRDRIPEPGCGRYVTEREQGARIELKWAANEIRSLETETPKGDK